MLQNWCQRKVYGTVLGVILFRLTRMTIFIKEAMQEVAEKLKIGNTLLSGRKWLKTAKIGIISTQHDEESRTVSLLFHHPDLLISYDIPTFLIKLLLPRVRENLAAKLECREIHERIWVPLDTLLIVNMLNAILKNYTIISEFWQHCWKSLSMSRILSEVGNWE